MTVPRIEWYGNFALQSREHDVRAVDIKKDVRWHRWRIFVLPRRPTWGPV